MGEEGIGMVLIRATELHFKIINCIDNAKISRKEKQQFLANGTIISKSHFNQVELEVKDIDDEESECLFAIRDALETLESQLSSLQALQHQQSYEREAALAEIDCCRKMLLTKLNEYKGEDLQVIQETSAFASESVKPNDDLLLPPYPTRPPRSLRIDSVIPLHISTYKPQNGININSGLKKNQVPQTRDSSKGRFGRFLSTTTKMVVTIFGVMCMLSLAGFEPRLDKKAATVKLTEGLRSAFQGPPGNIRVVEDGETRCLVKERVEVPFESSVATPNVNYGCG